MEAPETRIAASYLSHCSPEQAYQWLKDNSSPEDGTRSNAWGSDQGRQLVEYLLLRRKHPLIDLGLARYAYSSKTLKQVFRRGDIGVRCAVLSNSTLYKRSTFRDEPSVDLMVLVKKGSRAELQALALNPYLPDDVFEQLIKREGEFQELTDRDYMHVLVNLGKNPRLSTPYDDTFLNGYSDYKYNSVFTAAWELAKTLPATENWAYVLSSLLWKAQPPVGFKDLDATISRWRIDRSKMPNDKYYNAGYGLVLRSRLADLLDAKEQLLNSSDLALRKSFYRRFHPWEFKDWHTFLEKDGEEFLDDAISHNMELWKSKEERARLHDIAWKCPDPSSDMMMPNRFRSMEKHLRETHPEWFYDEDDEYSRDAGAIIRRTEQPLKNVNNNIESLATAIRPLAAIQSVQPGNSGRLRWFVGGLVAGLLIGALF